VPRPPAARSGERGGGDRWSSVARAPLDALALSAASRAACADAERARINGDIGVAPGEGAKPPGEAGTCVPVPSATRIGDDVACAEVGRPRPRDCRANGGERMGDGVGDVRLIGRTRPPARGTPHAASVAMLTSPPASARAGSAPAALAVGWGSCILDGAAEPPATVCAWRSCEIVRRSISSVRRS
jgi:hypothetical protein